MASGDKEAFPLTGVIQSSSRIVISQQSPSPSPGGAKPQSYKVFVLPPSQLNNLGLITRNENGRVILTQRPVESTVSQSAAPNSNAAMSLSFIKPSGGLQIQSGQSSSSVRTTPKKGYVASTESIKGGVREFQMHRQLTKITTPGSSPLGNTAGSTSRPMFARRSSSRRLLPQFTNYWKSSLEEVGYIRCPLRGCNYICLNFGEMTIHYYQCKGEPFPSKFVCTPCNGRLKSEEDLKSHLVQTHSREGRIAKKQTPKKVVELPKPDEKAQVWIRKRAYSKVHKVSWNIALGDKGYVNCFFKNCCFMALDLDQMIQHYGICNGTTAATSVECPYCDACAECLEKLEAHVQKSHAGNLSVLQAVDSEVNIPVPVPVPDSLPVSVPVQETNIASAATSGVGIRSSCVHQEKETVVLSQKPTRPTPVKTSASIDKTVQTVLSMSDKLPKSVDQSHSRLYSSDTMSKTTGSSSPSADTEVYCLFSLYEDFDEQRGLERDLLLDSQLSNVGFSVKRECENTSTVLCKTYSKDNQRLVKDDSYNERISSPLSALPCSFSDNISLCTDVSDIQVMRSSMSEGENNIMLVETKPETCVVEKLHEYMSHCDKSEILNEENIPSSGTSLDPKEQKDSAKLSVSQSSDHVSRESSAPQYEIFHDTEPEYPQEYSLNAPTDKTVNRDNINLSQNDIDDLEGKQITVEDCLFSESCASSSLVSYTEDVEEYIIPEIIEMTHYVVQSPVEVCSKAVNKRIQKPNEKQKIASSQVPTNTIGNLVPAIDANVTNDCKNKENGKNNNAEVQVERSRKNNPLETVKYAEPQASDVLQKKVYSDILVTSHDSSSRTVGTSLTDIQSAHPLFADTDDLQNLDVPILTLDSDQKDNLLNSFPNSQLINVQHAESNLSELNQELYQKTINLSTSDVCKLTYSVEAENTIEAIEETDQTVAEVPVKSNEHRVPEDIICNTRLMGAVSDKCEDDVQLDVTLIDNVGENVAETSMKTQENNTENKIGAISSSKISGERVSSSSDQSNVQHKNNVAEITTNVPCVSETCEQELRNVEVKENDLESDHRAAKTVPQAQAHSLVEKKHDESASEEVNCGIDESLHESNRTLISFSPITPSDRLELSSEVSFENSATDKFPSGSALEPILPVVDKQTTKEGICSSANANLKEIYSQVDEQTFKLVNSEAAGEFPHFHEIKDSVGDNIPVGVGALKPIHVGMAEVVDSIDKGIVKQSTSYFEGSLYENQPVPAKMTGLESNFISVPVLQEVESKVRGNKSSYIESSGGELSETLVISVEELESTNVKASEDQLSSASLTNIQDENKVDDLLLGNNMLSETFGSKDDSLSSREVTGFLSSVSESSAVIIEKSSVEVAEKILPDKVCDIGGNLSKEINNAGDFKTSIQDNQLESSSIAMNDLTSSFYEQKYGNAIETVLKRKDMPFKVENEDVSTNNSRMLEGPSSIVSDALEEQIVDETANFQNCERNAAISQVPQMPKCSDVLQEKTLGSDSSSLKVLEGDLISTISDDIQRVNESCSNYDEVTDSVNKIEIPSTPVPMVSESLDSDNHFNTQIGPIECTSSVGDVSKPTEETYSQNEKVSGKGLHLTQMLDTKEEMKEKPTEETYSQNEKVSGKGLHLTQMLDTKEEMKENEAQLVCEVSTETENAVQVSECTTPFVEDLGTISNKEISDLSSTEQKIVEMVVKESQDKKISITGDDASPVKPDTGNLDCYMESSKNQLSCTVENTVERNALISDPYSEVKINENFADFQELTVATESSDAEKEKISSDQEKYLPSKDYKDENIEKMANTITLASISGNLSNKRYSEDKKQISAEKDSESQNASKDVLPTVEPPSSDIFPKHAMHGIFEENKLAVGCSRNNFQNASKQDTFKNIFVESLGLECHKKSVKDEKSLDEKIEFVSEISKKGDLSESIKPFATEGESEVLKMTAPKVLPTPQHNVERDGVMKDGSVFGNEEAPIKAKVDALCSGGFLQLEVKSSDTLISVNTAPLVQEDIQNVTNMLNNEDLINNEISAGKTYTEDSECVTERSCESLEITGSQLTQSHLAAGDNVLKVNLEVSEISLGTDRPVEDIELSIEDAKLNKENNNLSIPKIEENIRIVDRGQHAEDSKFATCEVAEDFKMSSPSDLEREMEPVSHIPKEKETAVANDIKEKTCNVSGLDPDIENKQPESLKFSDSQSNTLLSFSDNSSDINALSLLNNSVSHECTTIQKLVCSQKSESSFESSKADDETDSHQIQSDILIIGTKSEEVSISEKQNHEASLDTSNIINSNDDPQSSNYPAVSLTQANSPALCDVQCDSNTKTSEVLSDELHDILLDTAGQIAPPVNSNDISPSLRQYRNDSEEKELDESSSVIKQETEQALNDKLTSQNSIPENVLVTEEGSGDIIDKEMKIVINDGTDVTLERQGEKIEFSHDMLQETAESTSDTVLNENSVPESVLGTEEQSDSTCVTDKGVNMECDDVEVSTPSRGRKTNFDVLQDDEQCSRNDLACNNSVPENDVAKQQLNDTIIVKDMKGERLDCDVKEITDAESALTRQKDNLQNASDESVLKLCQKQDNVDTVIPSSLPLEKTDDITPSVKVTTFSENFPTVSEYALSGSPKISRQTSESSTFDDKHLRPTAETPQLVTVKSANSICEEVQELVSEEPSILSCNVSIVADAKNITGFDFSAKSNILEYIKDQKEVHKVKEGINDEMMELKNEDKLSVSVVQLPERNESKKETMLGTEFAGISLEETSTLTVSEHNVSGGMCEQSMQIPTSIETQFSEAAADLSENVKPLSFENLSIALAGEMEDSTEHVSPCEMMNVDSYGSKAYSDNEKALIPQEAFAKTFENYTLDSPRVTSETDKKIYSTLDLQQILEGSDDSKHKLEDEETCVSMVSRENVAGSNETKDMLTSSDESDPSQLCIEKEIVTSSDSLKDIEKNFERSNSTDNKQIEKSNENNICSFDSEIKLQCSDKPKENQEKIEICRTQNLNEDIEDKAESESLCTAICDSHEKMDIDANVNLSPLEDTKIESITKSEENSPLHDKSKTELNMICSSHDKASPLKKRRHSVDFPSKTEIDGKYVNCSPPVKRKRSSSLCCDITTNYEKNQKLHLLKTTLIKETMKLNKQLENLETIANSVVSHADKTECCRPTEKQSFNELTSQKKLSNDKDIAHIEGSSVTGDSDLNKAPETKCLSDVCESSPVSSTNNHQHKRKFDDTVHLPVETNDIKVDAELGTVACSEAKDANLTPENSTEQMCTEPLRKRRRRSIETNTVETGAEGSSRRQSLRNKTNVLSEDSNSSNSSINSACEKAEGRKTRRGRKSEKVDNTVNIAENSVSNTPSQENNSEDPTTFNHTKTGNQGDSETQQKILPYDSEQSVMSEDSVFSKTDSPNEFDTSSNNSLEIDDSASSTVGSIMSDDSKDWAEDSQLGIDQDADMSEVGTSGRGRGRSRGRGRWRGRGRGGRGRRGRGRGRGSQSLTKKEEEEEDTKESTESTESTENEQPCPDRNEKIQCGKCGEKMLKRSYDRHNMTTHNGLSWIEGEPPFDMNNEKLILSILWKTVKYHKKQLTCENCGETKKSAVGFLSHIVFCQRTAEEREALKVKCEICGRFMIPASLKVHLQTHKNEKKPVPIIIESTRTKRAAAAKATSLMQEVIKEESQVEDQKGQGATEENLELYQRIGCAKPSNPIIAKWKRLIAAEGEAACHFPGCTFKGAEVTIMAQHYGTCEKSPRRAFRCELCDFQTKNEKDMKCHLETEHIGAQEDSDPEDAEALKLPKIYSWKVYNKLLFLGREITGTVHGDRPYIPAVKWTLKFMRENYAKDDLFPQHHTSNRDWIPVLESEYNEYLPQTKESISFSTLAMRGEVVSTDSVTFNWRKMKIFESDIIDGVPTLFTGGPIWALAWSTNPLSEIQREASDQFLAISCHQRMSDTFRSNERYVGKGLIQLWNFGPLDNLQRPTNSPKFVLGIAHEYGTVWDLEWCPSGCYETTSSNEHLQRLGLLAAACSDGCVHIFSVCFPSSLDNDTRYPIFRCKPAMTLIASENLGCELGGVPWSCLRLSWYKGKDHSIMAGGFNNGIISLWNIKTESLLLRKQEENSSILLPYKSFQAHLSCVTALSLAPQDEGRYLMSGSIDTTIKVWDMEDTSGPIPPIVRKGMVTDGIWLTHWLSSITSYDDVYSMGHCNTTLNPPRGYGFKIFPLLPQNSVAWSLSTTDWVNGIAQSSHAGELTAIFPHQLLWNVDTEKGMKDKRMLLSYVELKVILNETDEHKCDSLCSVPCKKQQLGDIQKEVESNKPEKRSDNEKIVFQLEEKDDSDKGGLSFIIERNPRKGKKCVITPLSEETHDSTSVSDLSLTNDSVDDGSDLLENIECISMLNQHERQLLLTFKKDLERLNVTSRLKVTFPYYNNEKKKSNSNDTVKEYLMIVGSVKDDVSIENSAQENGGPAKAVQDSSSLFTIPSDDYEAVERKFGMVFCDFPADDLSTIPASSRLWMRRSESMKTAPVEIYPVTSLNKVKWNPNCHSFLWLAAGYQCGLLRVPCISGMHNRVVEQLLRNTSASGRFGRGFNRTSWHT